jgi:acyl-coenzyme A thioesterase PaaI-like protein
MADTMLEMIQRVVRGESPPPPIAALIGFTITAVEPGRATVEMDAGARHANPVGTAHGGVFCDLADAAMGMADRCGAAGSARRAASSTAAARWDWWSATSSPSGTASSRARRRPA